MTTDENGVRHPECIADVVQLREEEEAFRQKGEKLWNRKAAREGWQRQSDIRDRKKMKPIDRAFADKAVREGWGQLQESKK